MAKKECCESMALALSRVRPHDRVGLMREKLFALTPKSRLDRGRDVVLLCMNKAPRGDKSALALVSIIQVNYCPFCGTRQNLPKRVAKKTARARRG